MGQDDGVNRSALPLAAVPLKYNQARVHSHKARRWSPLKRINYKFGDTLYLLEDLDGHFLVYHIIGCGEPAVGGASGKRDGAGAAGKVRLT